MPRLFSVERIVMMNDEIKALEERVKRLESVIVYLMCPKEHGVSEKNIRKPADQILEDTLSPHVAKGVNHLLQEYGTAEQVIQKTYAICNNRCEHKK